MELEFSQQIFEILITNSMKIHPLVVELFHANEETEGQTERNDEANSRFSQFCENV
jgi:uncharacterized protein (DUF169 family)